MSQDRFIGFVEFIRVRPLAKTYTESYIRAGSAWNEHLFNEGGGRARARDGEGRLGFLRHLLLFFDFANSSRAILRLEECASRPYFYHAVQSRTITWIIPLLLRIAWPIGWNFSITSRVSFVCGWSTSTILNAVIFTELYLKSSRSNVSKSCNRERKDQNLIAAADDDFRVFFMGRVWVNGDFYW